MKKIPFVIVAILCFSGCKNDDAEPEFVFGAKIDGQVWTSNVANSENSTVAATIAQNIVVVVGVQDVDKTGTALGLFFPEDIKLNEDVDFNPLNKVILAYTISSTEGYVVDPAMGGSGRLRVTRLDKENKVVEGSFTGEAIHSQNGSKIKIQNGIFRSKIYDTPVKTTPPGKR
ncbi:hypothetical protein [Dyadobacter arcticus]|uniref:Uncharacterized protein n=1 Tax=Dyadobacter arcticus TaxID=1078754 RepID=A0ABX0URQ4_9BACT|nr:hypothetical protein [Dyadobacter arcticus]NIJ54305.1 hypothetical protein [Dyadobacter arcticus]